MKKKPTSVGGDVLISPKFDPSNQFSSNLTQVYTSARLMHDIATHIALTQWASPPKPQELLYEFVREYCWPLAYLYPESPTVFEAFALGFNEGRPYRISCTINDAKGEIPEGLTYDEMRAICMRRVRLDLPIEKLQLEFMTG